MTEWGNDHDAEVLHRLARQEPEALALAYDRFGRAVFAVALRVVGQRTEAEEVVQDTFKSLWNHAGDLCDRGANVMAWLVTAARRSAIDVLRKRQRRIPTVSVTSDTGTPFEAKVPVEQPTAGEWLEKQEDAVRVRQALADLPAEQVEVLRLAFYSGLTHQEISDRLKLPLGTIKSRLRYGLRRLQGKLEDVGHD